MWPRTNGKVADSDRINVRKCHFGWRGKLDKHKWGHVIGQHIFCLTNLPSFAFFSSFVPEVPSMMEEGGGDAVTRMGWLGETWYTKLNGANGRMNEGDVGWRNAKVSEHNVQKSRFYIHISPPFFLVISSQQCTSTPWPVPTMFIDISHSLCLCLFHWYGAVVFWAQEHWLRTARGRGS